MYTWHRWFRYASLWHFLSCYEHERYPLRFLLSLFYSALSTPPYFKFCCMFCGNFWKTGKNISVFESSYSRSYFNLFLIYAVTFDARKYRPSQIYNGSKLIVQKIDLIQKYWVNFPNFQIKTFHLSFFIT